MKALRISPDNDIELVEVTDGNFADGPVHHIFPNRIKLLIENGKRREEMNLLGSYLSTADSDTGMALVFGDCFICNIASELTEKDADTYAETLIPIVKMAEFMFSLMTVNEILGEARMQRVEL